MAAAELLARVNTGLVKALGATLEQRRELGTLSEAVLVTVAGDSVEDQLELEEDRMRADQKVEDHWRNPFPGLLERTIPSSPRFLRHLSSVTARPRADTTLTPRLNVRLFMFAQVTAMVASLNTASSVQMEQSSNKSI